jgi:hypothetical protein
MRVSGSGRCGHFHLEQACEEGRVPELVLEGVVELARQRLGIPPRGAVPHKTDS